MELNTLGALVTDLLNVNARYVRGAVQTKLSMRGGRGVTMESKEEAADTVLTRNHDSNIVPFLL